MADETKPFFTPTPSPDPIPPAPLQAPPIFESPDKVDMRPGAINKVEPVDPNTATAKLRAWEDANVGRKAVRLHGGRIERGSGSKFRDLSPEKQAEHAALENLVHTEAEENHAATKLAAAKAAHEAAKAAVVAATKASDTAAAEAKQAEAEDAKEAAKDAAATPRPVTAPQPETHTGNL